MNQFLESYFKYFALIMTVLTSVIFVSYMMLRKKIDVEKEGKLNILTIILVGLYEAIHVVALLYTANNVILKAYTIFLMISLLMVLFSESFYIFTFIKQKSEYKHSKLDKAHNN